VHSPARRLASLGALAIAAVVLGSSCAVVVTTTRLHDDRYDFNTRPKGTAVVIGDSVGYGLTVYGGITNRLAIDGWGPVRSNAQVGLHAAPETATDANTVVNRIAGFRAGGLKPKVAVIVVGANDVGFPGGGDVARNVRRIETALKALGSIPVVWTTLVHRRADWTAAWNQALRDVATRFPNLHVCDWAAEVAKRPHYLERDGVHMTVGPSGGYVAMRVYVAACVTAATT
jgi:lysophospholipase L1-like esterase